MTVKLEFDRGTLVVNGYEDNLEDFEHFQFDNRTLNWRAPAMAYRDIVYHLFSGKYDYRDTARSYSKLNLSLMKPITPRPHQKSAMEAWLGGGKRGVVSLPTGAGKTILAVLLIAEVSRPTLVVVPTIDLLNQWKLILENFFECPVGALGGGHRDLQNLTVSTYDSAQMYIEKIGDKFGFIIFDECHHLPAEQYQYIARSSIAPFRLGLSATVERPDGKEEIIYELLGDKVYEGQISDMVSNVLAPYDVICVQVPLSEEDQLRYKEARAVYTGFIKKNRIMMSGPGGWQEFIRKSASLPGGRDAMRAYREQKQISLSSEEKLKELWKILCEHRNERVIIFTNDNALAYKIGKTFFVPVLTHHTKPNERKKMLASFKSGDISFLATSKVLNEGVDVPEASVGVVVSGSSGVREHVQRLGRILRHKEGKRAVLYEIVSKDTAEQYVNKRRRRHHAYQGFTKVHNS